MGTGGRARTDDGVDFCTECGSELRADSEFCTECGAEVGPPRDGTADDGRDGPGGSPSGRGREGGPSRGGRDAAAPAEPSGDDALLGETAYLGIGVVSGVVALILIPPLFGIIAVGAGVQLYRLHDEQKGMMVMGFGVFATLAGMALGYLVFAGM